MTKKEVKMILHNKELLDNCISYLWEIWNNESVDDIERYFRRLGFNDEDLEDFGINDTIKEIKEEL